MKILINIIFTSCLFATGKYGDSFLRIGSSARDIGLGQAIVADMANPSGFNVSPATIANINTKTFYLLLINQYGLAEYYSSGIILPFKNKQFLSINISGIIIDNIKLRPDIGNLSTQEARRDMARGLFANGYENFDNIEFALTSTFAKVKMGTLNMGFNYYPYEMPLGANIKIIRKKLHNNEAVGIGLDLGGIFAIELSEVFNYDKIGKLSFGLSINNLNNTHLFWSNKIKDIIPTQLISGFSYNHNLDAIHSDILFLVQNNNLFPNEKQYGIELTIIKKLFLRIGSRAGFNQGGLGFSTKLEKIKNIRLDYSFGGHDLGDAHRIGFEIRF